MEIKFVQHRLNEIGYGPIEEDGRLGRLTIAAIKRFQKSHGLATDGKVGPHTIKALFPEDINLERGRLLSTPEIIAKYGPPGPSNLCILPLPYVMKIEWAPETITRKIQCHKLVAPRLEQVFKDILNTYGLEEIERLGINIYSGCYNFRKMRNGNDWSRHSWGIAIDLYSQKNLLHQHHDTALFAKPEYKNMIQCFYRNGFVGLGPEEDRDWMHWQVGH